MIKLKPSTLLFIFYPPPVEKSTPPIKSKPGFSTDFVVVIVRRLSQTESKVPFCLY